MGQNPDRSTTLNPHLQNEIDIQKALAGQPRGELFLTSKLSPYEVIKAHGLCPADLNGFSSYQAMLLS